MGKVISKREEIKENTATDTWSLVFDAKSITSNYQIDVTIERLLSIIQTRGPEYQSLDRADHFLKDLDKCIDKLKEKIKNKGNEFPEIQ